VRTPSFNYLQYNLSQWQNYSGQDANSTGSPTSISNESQLIFEYNANLSSNKTVTLGDYYYTQMNGTNITGSVTLEPFTSIILINTTVAVPASSTEETTTSSGSSGGGSSSNLYPTEEELDAGYSGNVPALSRIYFSSKNNSYNLKVSSIDNSSSANITIGNDSMRMYVGGVWKINLDNDSYYDLYVRLDGINNSKTELFIQSINESILPSEMEASHYENGTATGDESSQGEISSDKKSWLKKQVEIFGKNHSILELIIFSILALVIIGTVVYLVFWQRRKAKGFEMLKEGKI
jgi:hypothetical protein